MIIGKYKTLDAKRLQPIIDYLLNENNSAYHSTGTHKHIRLDVKERGINDFWLNHSDLYDYIEKNVYPEHAPITGAWCKVFTADTTTGPTNKGEFMALHQDMEYEYPKDDNSIIHTTSILLHRSEDAIGGYNVLAGDSQFQGERETRFKDTRDIMSRLVVENLTVPGESMVWNGFTMHGVSEMTRGKRMALVVIKKTPFNEEYFKSG
tara:strand:+ start:586 stop:1206 length:621 start_codon:yes stop_codon:yes gene_type:complete